MLFFLIAGSEVEEYFGNKFLSFYLLSGIFSSGLYCLGTNSGIIGASGAVFATIAASIFISMKNKNYKKYFSLKFRNLFFIFSILFEFYYALTSNDNIGHWAHVFGSIFGILYYISLNKKGFFS
jgi:membrane associated rhomboid family serine protease